VGRHRLVGGEVNEELDDMDVQSGQGQWQGQGRQGSVGDSTRRGVGRESIAKSRLRERAERESLFKKKLKVIIYVRISHLLHPPCLCDTHLLNPPSLCYKPIKSSLTPI
jgi:hypothetical protein